ERQRKLLEDRCGEMTAQIGSLERQVQQLKPLQSAHATLQRQYTELQERICKATEEARRESTRLESELRRVEKCATAGSEIRERARLAAAAHARERRLAAAELQHTNKELIAANTEISKLKATVAELQLQLTEISDNPSKKPVDIDVEALFEARAALDAERAGAAKLEKALAAALADNATLAARINNMDNTDEERNMNSTQPESAATNICPIDSFLAE
ncbi:hypothetical protein SFRURICE_020877, partial [Spodoptera frugiperda]